MDDPPRRRKVKKSGESKRRKKPRDDDADAWIAQTMAEAEGHDGGERRRDKERRSRSKRPDDGARREDRREERRSKRRDEFQPEIAGGEMKAPPLQDEPMNLVDDEQAE